MASTPFARLARLGEELEATNKRLELTDLLAAFLRELEPTEVRAAVRLTIGQVFPEWDDRSLNISVGAAMSAIDELVDATDDVQARIAGEAVDPGHRAYLLLEQARKAPPQPPPLTILDVFHSFEEIAETSGRGSRAQKEALVRALVARATAVEAKYLVRIIFQEMRHGVSEGVMMNGIAKAGGVKASLVRRANQLWGEVGEVALVALTEGNEGLRRASLRLFTPIKPMLAQTADNYDEPFERFEGRVALEYKLDGARVQIHRRGAEVRIYSRNLNDVTSSLPDVVDEIRAVLIPQEAILEGEAVAVDGEGRPLPFQHLMRRFRRKHDIGAAVEEIPLQLYLFDALYLGGESLIDAPNQARWCALQEATNGSHLVPRIVPAGPDPAEAFGREARRAGHEGVMAKDLASTYTPGVRGKSWLKLKHVTSLDLAIVAADWGYGRRHGWLSNYHLAVRDEANGEFLVVGKTYKGLTDDQFREMTARLLELQVSRARSTVFVQPRVVVEVLFNEIQESNQYASGYALRFARISRIRDDKGQGDVDTLEALQEQYEEQFKYKGRLE